MKWLKCLWVLRPCFVPPPYLWSYVTWWHSLHPKGVTRYWSGSQCARICKSCLNLSRGCWQRHVYNLSKSYRCPFKSFLTIQIPTKTINAQVEMSTCTTDYSKTNSYNYISNAILQHVQEINTFTWVSNIHWMTPSMKEYC
jgi:hypothetical protein